MKTPFMYYGSKCRLGPWIVEHLPPHRNYVEPFAGSAAVLLAKSPSRNEVLNDINGDVVNFWRVLRDRPNELRALLELTPYAKDEYMDCRDADQANMSDVERARRFFVVCNLAFNASTAKVGYSSGALGKCGKPQTFYRRIDVRLAEVAARIRAVEIENLDALLLIDRWNDRRTAMYLDPPYPDATRTSKGSYATDNGGAEFHTRLLDVLRGFRGGVVLSSYANDLYDSLGWCRVERAVQNSSGNGSSGSRTECLYIKDSAR